MTTRQLLLNNLLDIGGVATLNNLYSREAKTFKGGLLYTRKLFKSYLQDGLIEKIEPIGKPANKVREVFYCLIKKDVDYIVVQRNIYIVNKLDPQLMHARIMMFNIALVFKVILL
jgi:hypothetical protein